MVDTVSQHINNDGQERSKTPFLFFWHRLSLLDVLLLGLIGAVLLLQLHLQFVQRINWDEFFYLSHIYDAQEGRLDKVSQMGHIYLFGWLTHLPGGEMAQITAGRVIMWGVQLATLSLIIRTASKFMSLGSALFSALSFLGLGFVFIHGTSFRADPIAALCMMYAIYVFAASSLSKKDLASLAVALALGVFVTIKVILFAPLLAILALWRLAEAEDEKALFGKFGVTLISTALLLGLGLFLHSTTLSWSESVAPTSSLGATAETVFLSGGLLPRIDIMKVGFFTGLLPSFMMVLGVCAAVSFAIKDKANRKTSVIILAMTMPLLSFIFYRNAYPYFYAFIFPSATVLAGYAVHQLKFSKLIIGVISVMMVVNIAFLYLGRIDETRDVQVQTIAAVHEIFPEPVNYFDRNGMIASYPKAGFFMSSWGLQSYTRKGDTRFVNEMRTKTVPMIVDNSPVLSAALRGNPSSLLKEDADALKNNYIPHWGHIWVAGKVLNSAQQPSEFSILIPGVYTIESEFEVKINGNVYNNNDVIKLSRKTYSVLSSETQTLMLRWGNQTPRPQYPSSPNPIFGSF